MPPCKDRDFCNLSVAEHEKRLHVTSIFFFVSDVITINYTPVSSSVPLPLTEDRTR